MSSVESLRTTPSKFLLTLALAMCLFYVLPIALANVYYLDDLDRVANGYASWSTNGRPLADGIMMLLNLRISEPIVVDLAPLPLVLGAISVALALWGLCRVQPVSTRPFAMMAAFLLVANPFFLSNLSYRFDVWSMCLALAFAIAPFTLRREWKLELLWSTMCLFLLLCLYQAALNAYIILSITAVLYAVARQATPTAIWRELGVRVGALVLSNLLYEVSASQLVEGSYAMSHRDFVALNGDLPAAVWRNIQTGYATLGTALTPSTMWILLPLTIAALLGTFYRAGRYATIYRSVAGGVVAALAVIATFCIPVFVFGILLALKDPVMEPRTMIGFGAALYAVALMFLLTIEKRAPLLRYFLLVPMIYAYSLVFAYGNALHAQERYDSVIAASILSRLDNTREGAPRGMYFHGLVKPSPVAALILNHFPVLDTVLPQTLDDTGWTSELYLALFGINYPFIETEDVPEVIRTTCRPEYKVRGERFDSYAHDGFMVIDFKKNGCQ